MDSWLDHKVEMHLDEIIDNVIQQHHIDRPRWKEILKTYVKKAVHTIKTSSKLLNDSIDFNKYIKIVTIEWKD